MELFDKTKNPTEIMLIDKAGKNLIPIGGTLELLPLCNMKCKMCYVVQSYEEMKIQGNILEYHKWLDIIKQACKEGLLFLTLTGGEPLIYPQFKELYKGLSDMGIVLSINTNGTLIDESWAEFFSKYNCRRLNITLYGKDNATYKELCGCPDGFDRVVHAATCLKKLNIPFRFTCTITPQNVNDLPELFAIAKKFEVALQPANYVFPTVRRKDGGIHIENSSNRLSPEDAAKALIDISKYAHDDMNLECSAWVTLKKLELPKRMENCNGFSCRAAKSGFWLNWKGELLPCGMLNNPAINLLNHTFAEGWKYIVNETNKISKCQKCVTCDKQNLCIVCPASCYTETGFFDKAPEYMCRMTDEFIHLLKLEKKDFYLPEIYLD